MSSISTIFFLIFLNLFFNIYFISFTCPIPTLCAFVMASAGSLGFMVLLLPLPSSLHRPSTKSHTFTPLSINNYDSRKKNTLLIPQKYNFESQYYPLKELLKLKKKSF